VPSKIAALLAGLTALTGAVIGLTTSFNAVHWTSAQTTLVATEAVAFWALAAAVTAHLWPQTKKQPVAVAGTVTAFVSATLSLGIGFAWWRLTQSQNASLISLVTAIVAVVSALAARSTVTAGTTPARLGQEGSSRQPRSPSTDPGQRRGSAVLIRRIEVCLRPMWVRAMAGTPDAGLNDRVRGGSAG
jgi:hypothetical protein